VEVLELRQRRRALRFLQPAAALPQEPLVLALFWPDGTHLRSSSLYIADIACKE
jgi:hypothetical protein